MDTSPDELEAQRHERLRRLNEALGANGRAHPGEQGWPWEIEWLKGPTDPYTGFYGHTVYATFEAALEAALEAPKLWQTPQPPPDSPGNG